MTPAPITLSVLVREGLRLAMRLAGIALSAVAWPAGVEIGLWMRGVR